MTRVTVIGAGSWGTGFSVVLADAGSDVRMWAYLQEEADDINTNHRNSRYIPDVDLPSNIAAFTDPAEALEGAEIVVFAVPAQVLNKAMGQFLPHLPKSATLVSLMKGIEVGTGRRMSQVLADAAGWPTEQIAVVAGPNLAKEIAKRQTAATVVACPDLAKATKLQIACHTSYFRPYTSTDVVGCEIGGSVKNVIALAVGMAEGMGFGDNAKAALMTRGLAEMTRLGVSLGADPLTFLGLAGMGDLVATCTSSLSRNRTFGVNLGKGLSVAEVVEITQQTAEGVKSCRSILDLAQKHGVDMPITEAVAAVIHEGLSPRGIIPMLMGREAKSERFEFNR